jgi:hypothetical protein
VLSVIRLLTIVLSKEEGQTIQWSKEEGQTRQWPKEGQTRQWPKEGETRQWPKEVLSVFRFTDSDCPFGISNSSNDIYAIYYTLHEIMLELDYSLFLILPSMEFELCLLIHYNANRLALCPVH